VDAIRAMGRKAVALQADLLSESATQALLPAAAVALGGPITVLVNNASIFEYDSIKTASRESWDRHIESNLRAPFVLTQALAAQAPDPSVDAQGEPRAEALVINMIDQRVRKLTPEFMSYTIAKMGLWAFTQTAAQGLAPRVRVNAIGPGPTIQGHRQSAGHFARQRANTVLQRGSNPEDIVGALLYFLNAPGVTGQLICTDGGQHLAWQTPDILGVE
jgi:NAD(P)-dependent dehydrogenase (short-subunit alcohol dehydrogenase family)